MSDPILPLAPIAEGTTQIDIEANDNFLRLSALTYPCLGVANDAAGGDAEGDVWIVGSAPAGAFATFDENDVAIFDGIGWHAWAPVDGLRLVVADVRKYWDGAAWGNDPSVAGGGGGGSDVVDVTAPSNVSGTVTLNFAGKSKYVGAITLGANVTTLEFSNLPGAGKYAEYEFHIKQDGTGSRTFAIPASHKALGGSDTTIASAANAVTVLSASTVDNGTTWRYAMQESA